MPSKRALTVVALVAALLSITASVNAQDGTDGLRDQREQHRRDAAEVAAEIDALGAEDAELLRGLEALEAHIALQEGRVRAAEVAIAAAETQAAQARQRAVQVGFEIDDVRVQLQQRAVDAFVGTRNETVEELDAADLMEATLRRAFLDEVLGDEYELVDELRTKVSEQQAATELADALVAEAEAEREAMQERLAELAVAKTEAEELRLEVQGRIAEWQTIGDEIEAADRAIAAEIRRLEEQARKAAEEEARRLAEEEAARKAAEEAAESDDPDGEATDDDPEGDETADDPQPVIVDGDFVMTHRPTSGRLVSPFGQRVHPIYGTVRWHYGIDLDGNTGDPIVAAASGTVLSAGWINGYGNTVVVSHGNGYTTLYAHMHELGATAGASVAGGEVIGHVGSTGWSTGSHLHLEVRIDGVAVDPALYLP